MKIEIEFTSSYEAAITIDGKVINYCLIGKNSGLTGLSGIELDETIGGAVAQILTSPLSKILQGWMPDEPNPDGDPWGTWDTLSEKARDEVFDSIY